MTAYRMYFYINGELHGREDFEADGDVAAIRIPAFCMTRARISASPSRRGRENARFPRNSRTISKPGSPI
jgi:hypothetical protein